MAKKDVVHVRSLAVYSSGLYTVPCRLDNFSRSISRPAIITGIPVGLAFFCSSVIQFVNCWPSPGSPLYALSNSNAVTMRLSSL